MNDISKRLSQSHLFAICPDAKRCKRACGSKYWTKVLSRKAKILCMYTLVEKEPVFYRIDSERSKP
jgi:hypothetical protein